eukprot:Gb_05756 [translate_table: standard]
MADINTGNNRPVRQCSNTRASRGPSRIVGNRRRHKVTAAASQIQPKAQNQDRMANFFTSFKDCSTSNVRSVVVSSSSLPAKRVLRPPGIASPTHLNPNCSSDKIL